MNNAARLLLTSFIYLLAAVAVEAQQTKRIFHIGYLSSEGLGPAELFVQGLKDVGYIEGRNIIIEFRSTGGKAERLPELAAELVRLKVDAIVANTAGETMAAMRATATIPIVMRGITDPLALHLVSSLAHPGGNVTGIDTLAPQLSGKRLELLKEVIPRISNVALLTPGGIPFRTSIQETKMAAQVMGLQIHIVQASRADELENVFHAVKDQRADALVQVQAISFVSLQPRIIQLAAKYRLPVMYTNRHSVDLGGLMSYGHDAVDQNRRAAAIIDKILKGRKPADIPVERSRKFELAINLKTANQIGVTIPQSVLYRADKVIK